MDEAVAGHASFIEMTLEPGNFLTVRDNGRGIPVDPHPKFKNLSALEVILTTLHSGGKFGGKVYATSGGLHGVGSSVVNALSETLEVEVARDRALWRQSYARGKPVTKLVNAGPVQNRRGTTIRFKPGSRDLPGRCSSARPGCTGFAAPRPICSAACEIRWDCDPVAAARRARRDAGRGGAAFSGRACATAWRPRSAKRHARSRRSGPARRTCLPRPKGESTRARGMGDRLAGERATGFSIPTATRSRRRRAARTRRGSALRC